MESVPVDVAEDSTAVPAFNETQVPTQTQVVDLSGVVDGQRVINDNVNSVSVSLNESINGVAGQLDVLQETTNELRNEVRSSNEQQEQQTGTAIVVDSSQWSEMQQAWWQARDTLAAAFFLEFVLVLLVAALVGTKLWGIFSKGWRS